MTTLTLIVTDAGRAEIVNATNTGTLPVVISEVALGTGRWMPDATATALNTELKRINTIGGIAVADDTIHLTIADYSTDVYSLGEFGLYTDTGVLFAIYSDAVNGITDKAAGAALLIATDTVFSTIAPGSIAVNGAGFTNPPASETVQGVMEIADQLEVDTGTDHSRAVTPQTLASILSMYLLSAGYNAGDVLAKLLTVDGVDSGLDADLWRGLTQDQFLANNKIKFASGTVTLNLAAAIGAGDAVTFAHGLGTGPVDFGASFSYTGPGEFTLLGSERSFASGTKNQNFWLTGTTPPAPSFPNTGEIGFAAKNLSNTADTITINWWARGR